MRSVRCLMLSLGFLAFAMLALPATAVAKQLKLLAVGNSFAVNANTFCKQLNQADPDNQLLITLAQIGGCPMEKHIRLAMLHEQNPNDPKGKPYGGKSLKQLLESEKWDVVTIQQYSMMCEDIKTYRPYARDLYNYIKKYCPNAEIVVYETWAYRSDDPKFNGAGAEKSFDMYRKLHQNYREIAAELGNLRIIPVGTAFENALQRPDWQFKFDPAFDSKTAQPPTLPNQQHSLHVGWFWHKDKAGNSKLNYDGHHAGAAGEFLAGLVWREFLLGVDARKNTFVPKNMTPEDAAILRATAHATVSEGLLPQGLK